MHEPGYEDFLLRCDAAMPFGDAKAENTATSGNPRLRKLEPAVKIVMTCGDHSTRHSGLTCSDDFTASSIDHVHEVRRLVAFINKTIYPGDSKRPILHSLIQAKTSGQYVDTNFTPHSRIRLTYDL